MQNINTNWLAFLKGILVLLLLSLSSHIIYAQSDYSDFAHKSIATQNTGMYVLGGWAIANIATGAYGWSHYSSDKMYFHQMNLMWNVFNLSIAGIALYKNSQIDFTTMPTDEIVANHIKTERILLINSALDLGYIGTGFLLRHLSNSSTKSPNLLRGYGNSLILQGGFLLVFDLILYQVLRTQRVDFIENLNLAANPDFIGMQILINI